MKTISPTKKKKTKTSEMEIMEITKSSLSYSMVNSEGDRLRKKNPGDNFQSFYTQKLFWYASMNFY